MSGCCSASVGVRESRLRATYHHAIEVSGQARDLRRLGQRDHGCSNTQRFIALDLRHSRARRHGAEPPSAIEIADRLKLPITTAHRGIHTLEQSGYIAQHPMSSRYVLANSTKRLTKALLARFAIRGASLHYLRYIAGSSQETTTLSVPLGWYALTVATVLGINEVVDPAPVGSSVELHNSASGLALLAFLPKAKAERYLAWVQKNKLGKSRAIQTMIAEARAQGYALSASESETVGELAVPIRNVEGEVARLDRRPRPIARHEIEPPEDPGVSGRRRATDRGRDPARPGALQEPLRPPAAGFDPASELPAQRG